MGAGAVAEPGYADEGKEGVGEHGAFRGSGVGEGGVRAPACPHEELPGCVIIIVILVVFVGRGGGREGEAVTGKGQEEGISHPLG